MYVICHKLQRYTRNKHSIAGDKYIRGLNQNMARPRIPELVAVSIPGQHVLFPCLACAFHGGPDPASVGFCIFRLLCLKMGSSIPPCCGHLNGDNQWAWIHQWCTLFPDKPLTNPFAGIDPAWFRHPWRSSNFNHGLASLPVEMAAPQAGSSNWPNKSHLFTYIGCSLTRTDCKGVTQAQFWFGLIGTSQSLANICCLWASKYLRNEENANKYAWQEPPYFYRNNSVSRHWDIASCSFASTSNTVAQPQRSLCGNSLAPRAVHQWADDRRRFSGCGKACRGWLMVF